MAFGAYGKGGSDKGQVVRHEEYLFYASPNLDPEVQGLLQKENSSAAAAKCGSVPIKREAYLGWKVSDACPPPSIRDIKNKEWFYYHLEQAHDPLKSLSESKVHQKEALRLLKLLPNTDWEAKSSDIRVVVHNAMRKIVSGNESIKYDSLSPQQRQQLADFRGKIGGAILIPLRSEQLSEESSDSEWRIESQINLVRRQLEEAFPLLDKLADPKKTKEIISLIQEIDSKPLKIKENPEVKRLLNQFKAVIAAHVIPQKVQNITKMAAQVEAKLTAITNLNTEVLLGKSRWNWWTNRKITQLQKQADELWKKVELLNVNLKSLQEDLPEDDKLKFISKPIAAVQTLIQKKEVNDKTRAYQILLAQTDQSLGQLTDLSKSIAKLKAASSPYQALAIRSKDISAAIHINIQNLYIEMYQLEISKIQAERLLEAISQRENQHTELKRLV